MTDDIVTRLRNKFGGQLPICAEAADEIERIRIRIGELEINYATERLIAEDAVKDKWQATLNFRHWYRTAWYIGKMLAEKTGEDVAEMMDTIDNNVPKTMAEIFPEAEFFPYKETEFDE
jgi:hypothetical protein